MFLFYSSCYVHFPEICINMETFWLVLLKSVTRHIDSKGGCFFFFFASTVITQDFPFLMGGLGGPPMPWPILISGLHWWRLVIVTWLKSILRERPHFSKRICLLFYVSFLFERTRDSAVSVIKRSLILPFSRLYHLMFRRVMDTLLNKLTSAIGVIF